MGLFDRNPNEVNYVGGKKHFVDVIKNGGPGEYLLWLNAEEDFNTNSTLIVAESEEALFFKDGVVEAVFPGGKYTLTTQNYPFLSRLVNAFSGGISACNCKVYFVRKADTSEVTWGMSMQVRDPVQGLATRVMARGAYRVQIEDAKRFLVKMVGNNISAFTKEQLPDYFRSEFGQVIKTALVSYIKNSGEEIIGICSELETLASGLAPAIRQALNEYGIRLVSFTVSGMDIPEDDPNRGKLEEAYAQRRIMGVLGNDWGRQQAANILGDLAKNPGAGGVAAAGAGMGMGMAAGGVFGSMAQQMFQPMAPQQAPQPVQAAPAVSRFEQAEATVTCVCGAVNPASAKFCNACGGKLSNGCPACGAENPPGAKFCNSCGARLG